MTRPVMVGVIMRQNDSLFSFGVRRNVKSSQSDLSRIDQQKSGTDGAKELSGYIDNCNC